MSVPKTTTSNTAHARKRADKRQTRQAQENAWAATFGRAPRNFVDIMPNPIGCDDPGSDLPEAYRPAGERHGWN